jgi:hypothetical protein
MQCQGDKEGRGKVIEVKWLASDVPEPIGPTVTLLAQPVLLDAIESVTPLYPICRYSPLLSLPPDTGKPVTTVRYFALIDSDHHITP